MKNQTYICSDCPRKCFAKRNETDGNGFCRAGTLPLIARAAPHYWEEPCISGEKGSGAIFFGGCVLKCVYCQNHVISNFPKGKLYTVSQLAMCIKSLENSGVHNISFITPTHYTNAIIEALSIYKPNIPVIYNCSGYESVQTLKRLDGLVDVYLPDFKYYSNEISLMYSKAPDYRQTALDAIKEMVRQTGKPAFDKDGMLCKGTLVRHLILPSNTDDSIKILDLLNEEFQDKILVSLMRQYYPAGKAYDFSELNRKVTNEEYNLVMEHLFSLDLDGFVQDEESADCKYTPEFTLS